VKNRKVFEIFEESDAGGTSYCWVVKRPDGFHLHGVESGHMAGPCETACAALNESGFQFGMDYVDITCRLSPSELQKILGSPAFILENISNVTVNGSRAPEPTFTAIVDLYRSQH